ncbi:MAG: shikimate dehydrogenase [Alphaproteobacteria bacterium]|nr:MAG: shikimate dehydrogenase [Alphaproteobacteria bacterium]
MTKTIKAGVVGWPIAHSRSPLIHESWLKSFGINGTYEKIAIEPGTFEARIRELVDQDFAGVNVTIPHKEAALALADEKDAAALAIGAANTLVFKEGKVLASNTDAFGFTEHLKSKGKDWAGKRALVIGAGGAARAVLFGLRELGLSHVDLANRTVDKARVLATHFATDTFTITPLDLVDMASFLGKADLVVNTTSLGMVSQPPLEISLEGLKPGALVYDLVYVPLETEMLKQAKALGHDTLDGLGMLLHQARPGFEAWFGAVPEVTEDLRLRIIDDLKEH